jgi:hypothetical protein
MRKRSPGTGEPDFNLTRLRNLGRRIVRAITRHGQAKPQTSAVTDGLATSVASFAWSRVDFSRHTC